MPPADEVTVSARPSDPNSVRSLATTVGGWGGGSAVSALVVRPGEADGVRAALEPYRRPRPGDPRTRGVIPRGMGRSYGDAAQLAGGVVLDMTRCRDARLNQDQGTVTAQAGVTIGELMRRLVPDGWILPVVPGTQHVTVGGAIASDIHGKNHRTAGTFGSHVRALGLLTSGGETLELNPESADGLFAATVGGMGLTGVILWAEIGLARVGSSLVSVDTDRAASLDDVLALLAGPGGPHRVAWLDLQGGGRSGRGIVTRAEHVQSPDGAQGTNRAHGHKDSTTVRAQATVPEGWPAGVLRASTVSVFNELRFRRAPRHERARLQGFGAHMFPLDALGAWPRLYGKAGLLQYQFVVPDGHEQVLYTVIESLRRGRVPCFLATLKVLGAANRAPLSFPLAGWALALDLPRAARGIDGLLDGFDRLVAEAGGRVYLTKDARLRPDAVQAMYPRLAEWRATRDGADPDGLWRSDLAVRTGLISVAHP
jgi:decaprenylphospho-beta-D-ribofuranose 2-oxidase